MGRAGFVSGAVYAQNLQAGSISKTLGGTGTDTVAVTFGKRFQNTPKVVVGKTSSAVTTHYVSSKTLSGFTLNIASSSLTSTATYDYVAMDDSFN
jgi:hypothetical protein